MDDRDAELAADAFALLSDPVRVEILASLWELDRRGPVSYSDLQDAVGVRDSGRFNYHLSQLTDRYLRKTPDGYRLRATGLHVVDLLEEGAFGELPDVEPVPVGVDCPSCGSTLRSRYDGGEHIVDCPDCAIAVEWLRFPPAGVEARLDDRDALVRACSMRARRMGSLAAAGVCPFCGREMAISLEPAPGHYPVEDLVHRYCEGCGGRMRGSVGTYLHDHPAVVAFLWDHGERVDDGPLWRFDFALGEGCERVSEEPFRVRQRIERDDERLEVVVDGDGAVVETRRRRVG